MKIPRHGTFAASWEGNVYIPGGAVTDGLGPTAVSDFFTPCIAGEVNKCTDGCMTAAVPEKCKYFICMLAASTVPSIDN
jgi:hypothetical protein